jgi:hypothetical protein
LILAGLIRNTLVNSCEDLQNPHKSENNPSSGLSNPGNLAGGLNWTAK